MNNYYQGNQNTEQSLQFNSVMNSPSSMLRDSKTSSVQRAVESTDFRDLLKKLNENQAQLSYYLKNRVDPYLENAKTNGIGTTEEGNARQRIQELEYNLKTLEALRQETDERVKNYEIEINRINEQLKTTNLTESQKQDLVAEKTQYEGESGALKNELADIDYVRNAQQEALASVNDILNAHEEREQTNIDKYGYIGGHIQTAGEDLVGSTVDVVTNGGADELFSAISGGKWDKVSEILLPAAFSVLGVVGGIAVVGAIINKAADLLGLSGEGGGLLGGSSGSGGLTGLLGGLVSGGLNITSDILQAIEGKLNDGVNQAVGIYADSMGKVNARLLGSGVNFADIVDEVRSSVGSSMLINESKLINQIVNLSERGINYNLEQRALLETLKEDLVPTFSALDGTLTRLVRIQQADLTLSQMGTEAKLLQLLNEQFRDTSYLSDSFDTINQTLEQVLATQLDTDQMTQFGYAIQKWLGGMYSVGVSSQAINSFADAINKLGTGDINKLGDSAANTLMAMVANRAGLSYASLLTEGLTADTTNELMKAMVEILQDIANNTSSNVVKSQWGEILNISMSDWRAIQNLTQEDISNLYNSIVDQQIAESEVASLIENNLAQNIHISEQIDNALSNTLLGFGLGIANDPTKYAKWKLFSLANGITSEVGGNYVGAISNILTEGMTFLSFAEDIMNLPRQLMSLLVQGDTGIGNLMSGYESQLTRGGMNINSTTSMSESSDSIRISNEMANLFMESFGVEENGGNISYMNRSDYEDYDSDLSVYGDEGDFVETSAEDYTMTTLQQQDQFVSATAQNIISQDSAMIRDINDLYAELFERQTTPIRVALAKVEDEAKLNIHEAIEGSNVIVSGEVSVEGDVFGSLSGMRG